MHMLLLYFLHFLTKFDNNQVPAISNRVYPIYDLVKHWNFTDSSFRLAPCALQDYRSRQYYESKVVLHNTRAKTIQE